jgi:hypothetical protein
LGGFSRKYSDPSPIPGFLANSVSYNSVSPAVAVGNAASPYIDAYPWSDSTGFGTRYSNPATIPTGYAEAVKFNNAGNVLGSAHATTPFLSFYNWSSGFGTRFSNPATLPEASSAIESIGFNPSDSAVVLPYSSFTSPYIAAYPWSNSTGFGTRYSSPATLPGYLCEDVHFSSDGLYVSVASRDTTGVVVYNWSSGFGTKVANSATHYGNAYGTSFNSTSTSIGVAIGDYPYMAVYPWSNGFGTKYANPIIMPTGQGNAISFV